MQKLATLTKREMFSSADLHSSLENCVSRYVFFSCCASKKTILNSVIQYCFNC